MESEGSDFDGSPTRAVRMVDGRYRLETELGRGGMGRVWRGRDTRLDRVVAVKELLLPEGMEPRERQRLAARMEREARAAAMGSHPSIVGVHDVVEDEGRPWIVMEYLSGQSLQTLVRQAGPGAPDAVTAWGRDLLDALLAAHGLGIVHRDVKPANVMITDSGRAVLTDFGIAQVAGSNDLTTTGAIIGSPGYIAPERLHYAPATSAADLWSLGATLFYAVEGSAPFKRGTAVETVRAVLEEEARLTRATGPLAVLIDGLLRKDPAQRLGADQIREMLSMPGGGRPPIGPAAAAVPTSVKEPTAALTGPTGVFTPAATSAGVQAAPAPRGTRLSWPLVAVILGTGALAVVAAAIVVFAPQGGDAEESAREDQSAAAQESSLADEAEDPSPSPSSPEPPEESAPPSPPAGTSLVADPAGFELFVPDGWTRRDDGSSVYYDGPGQGTYLQIDTREHPSADQVAHVEQNERETIDSGRLADYERLRIADVTAEVGGGHQSVAEWEFQWTSGEGRRQILTRNFTTGDGEYVTVAWTTPADEWGSYAELRQACLDSFTP